MRKLPCVAGLFLAGALSALAEMRDWTSAKGTTLQAEYMKTEGEFVYLKTPDGALRKIRFDALSDKDKAFVVDAVKSADFAPVPPPTGTPPSGADAPAKTERGESGSRSDRSASEANAYGDIQSFECRANPGFRYYAVTSDVYKADRPGPALFLAPHHEADLEGWAGMLRDLRKSFPGVVVMPRDLSRSSFKKGTGHKLLRAVEADVAARFRTDPARVFLMVFRDTSPYILEYATADRPKPVAGVVVVNTDAIDRIPRSFPSRTAVAGLARAVSSSRDNMARFFATVKSSPSRLYFSRADSTERPLTIDALLWAYAAWCKAGADASHAPDRDALAQSWMARAEAMKADDRERAYEYLEMAAVAAATPAAQGEANRRMQALAKEPQVEQYIAARRDLERMVEKYFVNSDGSEHRLELEHEFRKDADRLAARYPSSTVKDLLRVLSASPSD